MRARHQSFGFYFLRERMRQPQASRNNALLPKRQSVQMPGPTPGQQTKHMLTLRAVLDPQSNMNRQTLNANFGIQLPLINSKQTSKPAYSKPIIGSTIEPLAVLPKANRVDAQVNPTPPINQPLPITRTVKVVIYAWVKITLAVS